MSSESSDTSSSPSDSSPERWDIFLYKQISRSIISIGIAFTYTCGRANTILIWSVCTRIFSKTEKIIALIENIRVRVDGALEKWVKIKLQ